MNLLVEYKEEIYCVSSSGQIQYHVIVVSSIKDNVLFISI